MEVEIPDPENFGGGIVTDSPAFFGVENARAKKIAQTT